MGVKELWEVPSGRIRKGEVILTLGWPLTTKEYGGSWMYGSRDNLVSLGYVTSLEYMIRALIRKKFCRSGKSIRSSKTCLRAER